MKNNLYLLPTPLGDMKDPIEKLICQGDFEIDPQIFFIESRKNAMRLIKKLTKEDEIDDDKIRVLNVNSKNRDFEDYFKLIQQTDTILLSDGGMPGISDPGRRLIREAHRSNVNVVPLFATSSITAALASSGLNGEKFSYHGYLPREKGKRIQQIQTLEEDSRRTSATQIFIEAPYRNKHVWKDIMNFCDDETEFSISVELFTSKSMIKTARISDWRSMKWPDLNNKRAVFLINAQREERYR